ncbi:MULTISPECIES: STAS domain-containing protein [unclassified Amycolatopsis]|uniref:STAS domain-containing protein n=1 Tax=unclassified Amycolatopsis TaxID=2618356 RepID=UPI002E1B6925|nr:MULTISPECIES: STAS domain-containing protein [unclassified Amycolatopsis]
MTVLDTPRETPAPNPAPPSPATSAQRLKIRVRSSGSVTVVSVAGRLDWATCPALAAQLETVHERATAVAVDLRGVLECDALGVSVLVAAHAGCAVAGVPFAVVAPARPVRRVLQQIGIETLFTITESAGDAAADR